MSEYERGVSDAAAAVEAVLRKWEHELENKHVLHGGPIERVGQSAHLPLIQQSAEIARVRLVAVSAIRGLVAGSMDPAVTGPPYGLGEALNSGDGSYKP